jgi:hypothetical protein
MGTSFEVTASAVKFLSSRSETAGAAAAGNGMVEAEPTDESEIPF